MNSLKAYFSFRFRSTWGRIVFITVIALLILTSVSVTEYMNDTEEMMIQYGTPSPLVYFFAVFVVIICSLLPIIEFAPFNNKKNNDTLFSLPVDRNKMLTAHLLNGALQFVISFSILVGWWYLIHISKYPQLYTLKYIPVFYLTFIGLGLTVYSFYAFVFTQANATLDGIAFCALWTFFPFFVTILYSAIMDDFVSYGSGLAPLFIPAMLISTTADSFDEALSISRGTVADGTDSTRIIIHNILEFDKTTSQAIIISAVAAIICIFCLYQYFERRRCDQVGDISESWLGYKMLGPVYSIGGMLMFSQAQSIALIVFIITILGYTLYRRGIRYKKSDYIVMAISLAIAVMGVGIHS